MELSEDLRRKVERLGAINVHPLAADSQSVTNKGRRITLRPLLFSFPGPIMSTVRLVHGTNMGHDAADVKGVPEASLGRPTVRRTTPHTAGVRIGPRLRMLRIMAGLTQEELAARAGLNRKTIYRIEQLGQEPSPSTLAALAAALGRDPAALLNERPPSVAEPPGVYGPTFFDLFRGIPESWTRDAPEYVGAIQAPAAASSSGHYAMEIQDDDCWPDLRKGDIVVVRSSRIVPHDSAFCCIILPSGRRLVRRLTRRDGALWMTVPRPDLPPELLPPDARIIGVITALIMRSLEGL